jgi:uncharacterized protein YkwD
MKPIKQLFIKQFVCAMVFLLLSAPSWGQIYTYKQIEKATERHSEDTLLAIEFKAAIFFHELINEYRKNEGKSLLEWSNVFWLTSRNHNMWMAENGFLTHTQTKKSRHFSGESPSDRLKYVLNEACGWSGENCLYNYSYNKNKTITDAAYEIAKYSFTQWKNSSGHNKNMLDNHAVQGTSFVIDKNGTVWGTSLFGYCGTSDKLIGNTDFRFSLSDNPSSYVAPQQIVTKEPTEKEPPVNKSPTQKYSSGKTQKILGINIELAMDGQGVKKRKYFQKAAIKHSLYMYHAQTEDVLQEKKSTYFYGKDTRQRLFKSSKGRSIFLSKKQEIQEFTFYQEYSTYSFGIETLEEDIQYWIRTIALEDFKLGGVGVKVGKRKEVVKVAVSLILQPN